MSATRVVPERGDLAIVLHSHMPYVEGFGTWPFGEEWLLEAIATCYLPLIDTLERWAQRDGAVATVGITPVLADQLALPGVGERFLRFMNKTRAECHRRDIEGFEREGQHQAARALRRSANDYERASHRFEQLDGNLLTAFRRLGDAGVVELLTSSATHAVLPLIGTEAGLRLQLRTGVRSHRERFGRWDGGFWLPECAYRSGLEQPLAEAGARAFCVDQTGWLDDFDQLQPIGTDAGPIAVPIDWSTISLVWDSRGYPSDPVYRDYHAHTLNGMRPWANDGAAYDHDAAHARAREHAREFVASVGARLDDYRAASDRLGLCVCALDTELLGHWWYEGPAWLDAVADEVANAGIRLVTLAEGVARHRATICELHESSWGAQKDLSTWDSPGVAELRWSAAEAELKLVEMLAHAPSEGAAAQRAARELLALQSSDWAFMCSREVAGGYPAQRADGHSSAFRKALAEIEQVVQDSRSMPAPPEANLRGLAPRLDLAALLEPASPWGRQSLGDH
ncbi:MAG: 1,4-alpha-glucan branching protein domain-containing protein [Solirubrobacterales bacterium]